MFEVAFIFVSALVGVGVYEDIVVPTATKANEVYIKPAVSYTKEAVIEGVDFVKEKIN